MISTPDRQQAVALSEAAHRAGARWSRAGAAVGSDVRTYQRWTAGEAIQGDGRPTAVRPEPANKLSAAERAPVRAVCHAPGDASVPPGHRVPRVAAEGQSLAAESRF